MAPDHEPARTVYLLSLDSAAALLIGGAAAVVCLVEPESLKAAEDLLGTCMAIGTAVLAASLTALAIFIGILSDDLYLRVLAMSVKGPDAVREVTSSLRVTAWAGAAAIVVGGGSRLSWPLITDEARAWVFGASAAAAAYALVGALLLVQQALVHVRLRLKLDAARRKADQ